jgi:hypothetical protein
MKTFKQFLEQIAPKPLGPIRTPQGKKIMQRPLDMRTPEQKMDNVKGQAYRKFGSY